MYLFLCQGEGSSLNDDGEQNDRKAICIWSPHAIDASFKSLHDTLWHKRNYCGTSVKVSDKSWVDVGCLVFVTFQLQTLGSQRV